MRILLLSTYFQPDIASTGVLMTRLAEELGRRGHEVTVVTSMPHYGTNRIWPEYRRRLFLRERRGAIPVHRVYLHVPRHRGARLGRLLSYASFNAFSALAGLRTGRPDVILVPSPPLTNGLTADFLSRVRGIPFIYNVQDLWPDVVVRAGVMTNRGAIALFRRMERYIYRRAAAVAVISEGFRRNLLGKGVPEGKIRVIPNFFDTEFVRPLPRENGFRAAQGLNGKFVVLFAGNIGYSQGLETVLEAARELEDAKDVVFLIVGDGVARQELVHRARDLGLSSARFLPFQPHDALPEMYAASDVCLVPLRRGFARESVPCKVFTIMAAGRPLVASVDPESDTWGFVEEAGCGLCVPPEDAESLAGAIRRLYETPEVGARLGEKGREVAVGRYTPQQIARQYEVLLETVVS